MTNDENPKPPKPVIPALFATIHFRSESRPDGYTDDDIAELNALANAENLAMDSDGEDPA